MTYEIVRDGSYFRILYNGEYSDSDPLYMTTSEAQREITRMRCAELNKETADRAYIFVQGYFN